MNPLDRLVRALRRLPGIGEKSATRLALFIVRDTKDVSLDLIQSLTIVREKVKLCQVCQNLTEEEALCSICRDSNRNKSFVCVVQEPVDLMMVEKTGEYRGLYHILHGALSPLDGIGPDDIRIKSLEKRLAAGGIHEVILATNTNPEGEATALYLKKILSRFNVKISRIATGLPVGGTLEYTDPHTLLKALDNRKAF
ncbi:MAG: recombination protein RecR [Deltaproteobacteria bacterium]|nr:recombination protein RecR [Deltaproteobacteria bacterium]